jgi:predicted nucleic acid-binding protein
MSILTDTKILLRGGTQPDHPSHTVAVESVAKLLAAAEPVYFTLQNLSEFWNVATRPVANNGLGFSDALALGEPEKIERFLTVLPDVPAVYGEWKRLIVRHSVLGSKVHDARLGDDERPRHPQNSHLQHRRL